MRKIFFLLSIALFLLSWCCSCTLFSSRDLVLTEKDSGKTLYLQAGDTVTLHLEANPSTGY